MKKLILEDTSGRLDTISKKTILSFLSYDSKDKLSQTIKNAKAQIREYEIVFEDEEYDFTLLQKEIDALMKNKQETVKCLEALLKKTLEIS